MNQLIKTFEEAIACNAEYVAVLLKDEYTIGVFIALKKDFETIKEEFEDMDDDCVVSSCWAYTLSEVEDLLELNKYK